MDSPLVEVFGYPIENMSQEAINHRQGKLCPYHNSSGLNCTKNSAEDPLGVCSIRYKDALAITCPVRFRQQFHIVADAAQFFFPEGQPYKALTEVRLYDAQNVSAGNIDIVLVQVDAAGRVLDFGALEVQAVYISGNVTKPFRSYIENPSAHVEVPWRGSWPKPDYLSSSRKRLAPQLLFKGGILRNWNKKLAVAVHSTFFETLPPLAEVSQSEADMVWLVYDLVYDPQRIHYDLKLTQRVYTRFEEAVNTIAYPQPGDMSVFVSQLENRMRHGKFIGVPEPAELPPVVEPQSTDWSASGEHPADLNEDL